MDSRRRVLLVGKRAAVLARLAEALREQGVEADLIPAADGAGVEAAAAAAGPGPDGRGGYDVVGFGRALREGDRARLRAAFIAADPETVFVDGYAPIIPLLVAQFEQALDRRPRTARLLVDAAVRGGIVDLELRSRGRLRITSYRLDALHRGRERVVFDREAEAGAHSATLDARTARSPRAFVVIRAGDETAALPVG
jgi:hypothetical protein